MSATSVEPLVAALRAWEESKDEASRHEALSTARTQFEELPLGLQNILLDLATVAHMESLDMLMCIWRGWHGEQAEQWLSDLQRHGLVTSYNELVASHAAVGSLGRSILEDASSQHHGSRIWLKDSALQGLQQVSC
jgi:hypothetical protein